MVTFPVLIILIAVEVTSIVEVVLVGALEKDVSELDRPAELDTVLLVLEVTWRTLTIAPAAHVAGAQSLAARTERMEARRMVRERGLSGGVIVQRIFIASGAKSQRERERTRKCGRLSREKELAMNGNCVLEINYMALTLQGCSQMR